MFKRDPVPIPQIPELSAARAIWLAPACDMEFGPGLRILPTRRRSSSNSANERGVLDAPSFQPAARSPAGTQPQAPSAARRAKHWKRAETQWAAAMNLDRKTT